MWLFLPYGFFSAVWCEKPDQLHHVYKAPLYPDGAMMIRARDRSHLELLLGEFTDFLTHPSNQVMLKAFADRWGVTSAVGAEGIGLDEAIIAAVQLGYPILDQAGSDYRYRIFMERKFWASFVAHASMQINYSNFKNEAAQWAKAWPTLYRYKNTLSKVWSVMFSLQNNPIRPSKQSVLRFDHGRRRDLLTEEDVQAHADWEDATWWNEQDGES